MKHTGFLFVITFRYNIMKACWTLEPTQRPTFSQICTFIQKQLAASKEQVRSLKWDMKCFDATTGDNDAKTAFWPRKICHCHYLLRADGTSPQHQMPSTQCQNFHWPLKLFLIGVAQRAVQCSHCWVIDPTSTWDILYFQPHQKGDQQKLPLQKESGSDNKRSGRWNKNCNVSFKTIVKRTLISADGAVTEMCLSFL